ncbi:hypothetical protein FGRMN_8486 [Fusarium graminum]|nr:hypothetical protein FGRMN_8486 [Fusarium graminum]
MSDEHNHLAESGITLHSDSELYSAGDDLSSPPSSNSPVILYKPPTVWSLIRGTAINLLLPFVNGMMLGFGELFAHEAAFRLGWGGTKPEANDKVTRRSSVTDYRDADIYPPVPENLQKIPSNIIAVIRSSHLSPPQCFLAEELCALCPRALSRGHFAILSRTLGRKLGDARQFGTALKSARTPLASGARVGVKNVAAPIVLGGVSSSRTLSIWGYNIYGGKKTEEPAVEAITTTPEAPTPPATIDPTPVVNDAPIVPAEAVAEVAQTTEPSSVTPADFDLATIADLANPNILSMPENLGFLRDIGLDYGWGPTSVMQWVLEHIHVYTGFGWGGSIIATAFLLRAVMFYPQVRSVKFSAGMNQVKQDPQGQEAIEMIKKGYQTQDREMMQKGQFLQKMVREKYNASMTGMFWPFVQIPFSFGLFRIINGMTHIPVPSLEDAGFLWFHDLTVADPFYLLPAMGTGFLVASLVLNSKYQPAAQKAMMKKMMYVMGGVTFIFTSYLAAGVNIMMVSTGAAALATSAILNNEAVRRVLDLPVLKVEKPAYKPPRVSQTKGIEGLRERLTENLDEMKKGMSDQLGTMTNKYSGTAEERAQKARKEQMRKLEDMRRKLEREEFEKKYKR